MKVFLSSTYLDLIEHRKAALEQLLLRIPLAPRHDEERVAAEADISCAMQLHGAQDHVGRVGHE